MTPAIYHSTPAVSRYLERRQHRDVTADHFIRMIEESGIIPIAMQTISPYKTLNQTQCEHLAGGLRDCIVQRLDAERRIPVFTPLLTIYERNDWDKGYHIHNIIPFLPLNIWASKKRVKQQVKKTFNDVSKQTGMDWKCGGSMTREFQIEFYKYCIKNPLKTNTWNSNYEHGRMVNYPNGRGGIDYQIADIDYEYDRYAGWRGLVEYMCKNLYTMNDIESDVCESTYLKLHRYNTEKSINKNVTSTLDEFLYD